jgi:glycosyltransferase involved in cell wall biosynthesis
MKRANIRNIDEIILFNIETDLKSQVLGSNIFWIEEFRKYFRIVTVVSTHLGSVQSHKNVKYIETGGGNVKNRINAICRLIGLLFYIFKKRKCIFIFYHMSTKPLFILGFFVKVFNVRQALWYSHSQADIFLKVTRTLPNYFFSPTLESFPLKNKDRVIRTNHAIPIRNLTESLSIEQNRNGILSVGRVVRIKNLEKIVSAVGLTNTMQKERIEFIGPLNKDLKYETELKELATNNNVNLNILGPVSYLEILELYKKYDLYYSGTPKSIDKATIEAAINGCLVITECKDAQYLTGMDYVWDQLKLADRNDIVEQLNMLSKLNSSQKKSYRSYISQKAASMNNIESTISNISRVIKNG